MPRIPLTKGQYALVDEQDWEEIACYYWSVTGNGYAQRSSVKGEFPKYRPVKMHRHIMKAAKGDVVHHINGDGLDNRRSNLRLCRPKDNSRNRRKQGPKGITFQWGKYVAQITVDYQNIYLGRYATQEEAMRAYDIAAKEYFGEFAQLNFKESK